MSATRLLVACGVVLSMAAPAARAATPAEIDNAIKRGQAFLLSKMKVPGRWEEDPKRMGNGHSWQAMQGDTWGGYTAVATYALLASGMSPQHPDVAAAIEFLKTADMNGPYSVPCRTLVWTQLPLTAETRTLFKRDLGVMLGTLNTSGAASGLWDYQDLGPHGDSIDHSASQFGVLGIWSCAQGGLSINPKLWEVFDTTWKAHQHKDGSWSYAGAGGESTAGTLSMTAAGVATLFITQENIPSPASLNCEGDPPNEAIERGLAWINAHFGKAGNDNYLWFAIERIGAASGRKHFGGRDWYEIGAQDIVTRQAKDGSWTTQFIGASPVSDTALALLFLSRGRAAVLVNKLNHGPAEPPAPVQPPGGAAAAPAVSPVPAPAVAAATAPATTGPAATQPATMPVSLTDWNQRPRDVSAVTRWIGRQSERYFHWQVLDFSADHRDLMEAHVLYISGSKSLAIDDEGVGKLRRYVEDGGLILGNADCGKQEFAASFRALGNRMFPKYKFRELPAGHVINSGQAFRADRWKHEVRIEGLSNGSRELMLLLPTADPGRAWQENALRTREHLFQLASNIFFYATDKRMDRLKGQGHFVIDRGVSPRRRVSVARVVTDGNWDPEPGGWRRLRVIMRNDYSVGMIIEPVKLGSGKLSASLTPVAHLTGTDEFKLDTAQREELKQFVEGGGTLVIDAAGGSRAFADAAERELAETFGEEAALELKSTLSMTHPLYSSPAAPIRKVGYRRTASEKVVGDLKGPRLRGITINDRLGVIFSREDISTGLVGHDVDGIIGYDPASATALMRNVVLHGTGLDKAPLRPASTGPAGDGLE